MEMLGTIFGGLLGMVVFFAVTIGIFLLLRAFWLWYWGISETHKLLREIREELRDFQINLDIAEKVD